MRCYGCGQPIEIGVYVVEWDEDGTSLITTGETCRLESIFPKPNERDIWCSDKCLDLHDDRVQAEHPEAVIQ